MSESTADKDRKRAGEIAQRLADDDSLYECDCEASACKHVVAEIADAITTFASEVRRESQSQLAGEVLREINKESWCPPICDSRLRDLFARLDVKVEG